jgi:hypothetical protein
MPIRKVILVVKMIYDYSIRKFTGFIEYPEEGFEVILTAGQKDIDVNESFSSLMAMCNVVKENKGEMISFGLQMIFKSSNLQDDFIRWRSTDRVLFKTADINTDVDEGLEPGVPPLFASVGAMEQRGGQALQYYKFQKKKLT